MWGDRWGVFVFLHLILAAEVPIGEHPSQPLFNYSLINPNTGKQYRSFSGRHNNLQHHEWGAVGSPYVRLQTPVAYDDGFDIPRGGFPVSRLPSARLVSNKLMTFPHLLSSRLINDLHTYFGLFLVMGSTEVKPDEEPNWFIPIPQGDVWFDPTGEGNKSFPYSRSSAFEGTGVVGNPRIQYNEVSHLITGAGLYGTDDCQGLCDHPQSARRSPRFMKRHGASVVTRAFKGGKLLTEGTFEDEEIAVPNQPIFRAAGDPRANKLPPLYALHRLFVLEHNRLCDQFAAQHPTWDDETLFQEARRFVIAFIQKIATREWLATLVGEPLPPYKGYNSSVNPSLDIFFTTVAFRYGHSKVNSVIPRRDKAGNPIREGDVIVRDIQWRPDLFVTPLTTGIEPILRGIFGLPQGDVGLGWINDLRNMNTNHPLNVGMSPLTDLAAWNIQRGRDHGLPGYNVARQSFGLPRVSSFANISSNPKIGQILSELYSSIDEVDPYVGALCEDHLPGANFGPMMRASFLEQLARSRDGDRFWYENPEYFTKAEIEMVYNTTLGNIIARNSEIDEFPSNVFFAPVRQLPVVGDVLFDLPADYETIDLSPSYRVSWKIDRDRNLISFDLQAQADGWIGIGFSPDNFTMKSADIIMTIPGQNGYSLVDCYALDVGIPTPDANLPGGVDDLINASVVSANGRIRAKFSRNLVTGDQWDKPIPTSAIKVIFAYNPSDKALVYHGPTRSATSVINFFQVTNSTVFTKRPREEVKVSQGVVITLAVLIGVCGLFCLIVLGLIVNYRAEPRIRLSVFSFCCLTVFSVFPSYAAIVTQFFDQTAVLCMANFWLMGVSFQLFYGSFFIKTWRIYQMMKDVETLKVKVFSNLHLLGFVSIFVFLELVYLAIWSGVDAMKPTEVDVSGSDYKYIMQCRSSSDGWLIAWVASKSIMLLGGAFLATQSRRMSAIYNEAKQIAAAVWVVSIICVISIPLAFLLRSFPDTTLIIEGFALLVAMTSCMALIFLPKFYAIIWHKDSSRSTSRTLSSQTGIRKTTNANSNLSLSTNK